MILTLRWHAKSFLTPSEIMHVMDDIVCIHRTVWRLLDAAEVRFVAERYLARLVFFLCDNTSPEVEAAESIIQNILDLGVVFLVHVTRRVQIQSVRYLWVQNNEDGVVAAQNNSNRPSSSN